MSKGRIRHIALSVPDPWATAAFYKSAFGMTEVGETDSRLAEGVFLTDGVINLALLKFKDEHASQGKGVDYVGLHHVGFWVDDVPTTAKAASASGAEWLMGDPTDNSGYEVKYTDPNGIIFDISQGGWGGAQKNPGEADNAPARDNRKNLEKFEERRAEAKAAVEKRKAGAMETA
jgi:methylmalonyl-CoA/ethylmalonyl-CoA epimerase